MIIQSWTGETFDCGEYVEPDSLDALAAALKRAKDVRVIGSRHSMMERIVPAAGGTLIDLRRFNDIALPPPASGEAEATVSVGAGATLDVLTAALSTRGWALCIAPTQPTVTVAGAISSGSHNTARTTSALLADEVVGLEAMSTHGEHVTFSAEELPVARVALGACGAITRIKLRCVPAFDLVQTMMELDADEVFSDLGRFPHDHLWLNWKLQKRERVHIRIAQRNAEVPKRRLTAIDRVPGWQRTAARATIALAKRWAPAKAGLMASFAVKPPVVSAAPFVFFQDVDWVSGRDASIAVPIARLNEARLALKSAFAAAGYVPHLPILIRFLPASDKTLLALNSGQHVAVFELMSFAGFADFELGRRVFCETLAAFSPRIHWAKGGYGDIASSYPAKTWARFSALRKKMDPEGKLASPWLRSVLPA